jgi:iron complex outermembrane receptor protein
MHFVSADLFGLRERGADRLRPVNRGDYLSRPSLVLIFCAALGFFPRAGDAQPAPVQVTVRARTEDDRPIEGAAVKSGAAHAATDAFGRAVLQLSPGGHVITIARLGFVADTLRVALQADTTLEAGLREGAVEIAPITVSSTRAERRIEDEPERVEVLAGEDVTEKALTRPGDVTTLVKEIAGVRPQITSPATGAAGLRIQGLRAQYSAILLDGLPLHGTRDTGLGLLQIPPLDVQQAEVIKGAATALYGPSALSGVLDILSRRPSDTPERMALLNLTTRSGADASYWLSRKFSEAWGATFLGGAHTQELSDVNHDGWADLPGYSRVEIRPRLFWNGEQGRSAEFTIGTTLENREGGGGGDLRQHADTRHGDAGASAHWPMGSAGVLVLRGAWSGDWQALRQFDPTLGATPLHDDHQTGFAEATYLHSHRALEWLVGSAFELDDYGNRDLRGLDFRYGTPAALGQLTWTAASWLSASASTRVDAHNIYGTRVSPRLSVLAHRAHTLEARISAGAGFHAPTPFTEESEALPLTRLRPTTGLAAERAKTLSLDLTARRSALEVNATGFASRLERPVLLEEPPDSAFAYLVNAPGPTRSYGFETYAFYDKEPLTVTANYSYLHSTEHEPGTAAESETPLTPRHSAGLDISLEDDETNSRIGLEVFYTGTQSLEHDPYRTSSVPFATIGILGARGLGRALFYVNAENLADVRQTHYEPMLLPGPSAVGRLTVDAWAPQEGRTVNAGVRLAF